MHRRKKKITAKTTAAEPKPPKVSDELIYETILQMCRAAGLEGAVKPEEIAQTILPDYWQTLLKRVRLTASKQAQAGDLVILRKGEPADPTDFKGLVKFQITPQGMEKDN